MGGKQSKTQIQKKIVFQSRNTHPKFSSADIVQLKDNDSFHIQINHSVGNEQIMRKWQQNIAKLSEKNKHVQALYFPRKLSFDEKGVCGRSGIIKAQYDFFPYILKDQILNRKAIKQDFSQSQLWYTLYMICCAGEGVHSKGQILGDVRPENVFVNQNGQIRVSNLYTFHDENTNYHKFMLNKEKTFLSPEQIIQLQQSKMLSNLDLTKSQCFSIGMTLLSAALLTNQQQLYSPATIQFSQQLFNHQLTTLKSLKLNKCLISMILGLCQYDPGFRLTCKDILKTLQPYQNSILQLEPFIIDATSLPHDIKNRVDNLIMIGSSVRGSYAKVVNLQSSNHLQRNPDNQKMQFINTKSVNANQLPQLYRPSISSQLPPIQNHHNINPPVINNSLQSIQSNQTNFTFQGSNNNFQRRFNPSEDNLTFNRQDLSSIQGNVPSNLYTNINNQSYSQDISGFTSFNTMTPQGYYYSGSQRSNQVPQILQSKNILQEIPQKQKMSNPSQLSVYQYRSKVDSFIPTNINVQNAQNTQSIYIPTEHKVQQDNNLNKMYMNQQVNPERPSLASMGRETHSIRPEMPDYLKYQSNTHQQNGNLFRSYQQALKNVDRKLEQSRKLFPE